MNSELINEVSDKIRLLNQNKQAVIFVVTGPNGSGKTVLTKLLLNTLPFHQSYNLGSVTKTIRYIFHDERVTYLENFTNKKISSLFTPIVQFACKEYQNNGVNVIIDGVQIDTKNNEWGGLVTGGIILSVKSDLRISRNQNPDTHFNRKMDLHLTDNLAYAESKMFVNIVNDNDLEMTYKDVLLALSCLLDDQLSKTQVKSYLYSSTGKK